MKKAEVFDLNNTLRDKGDKPNKHVVKELKKAKAKGEEAIVLSTEPSNGRGEAAHWLKEHHIPDDELIMRKPSDAHVRDDVEKDRLLKEKIGRQFKVTKAYDDKGSNIRVFKKHGIKAKKV